MNVRIFWVRAMKCMCAQTRPCFILSSERVFGGMEFEPMLTPREKSPLPENFPRGGSNPRHCGQRAQALPTELFRPPSTYNSFLYPCDLAHSNWCKPVEINGVYYHTMFENKHERCLYKPLMLLTYLPTCMTTQESCTCKCACSWLSTVNINLPLFLPAHVTTVRALCLQAHLPLSLIVINI